MGEVVSINSKRTGTEIGAVTLRLFGLRKMRSPLSMGKRIRQSARGQSCSLRLMGCRNDTDTVVLAHLPCVGKGMGYKSGTDFFAVYACAHCHDIIDKRGGSRIMEKEVLERQLAGLFETQATLIEKGLLSYDDA